MVKPRQPLTRNDFLFITQHEALHVASQYILSSVRTTRRTSSWRWCYHMPYPLTHENVMVTLVTQRMNRG